MNPEGNFALYYKKETDFFLWIIFKEDGPFEFRLKIPHDMLDTSPIEWVANFLKSKKIEADDFKEENSF